MTVTVNAHQLNQLINKTISHMGSEYTEPLNGIRIDVDATHLYAVASNRYTLAAARYQLNHGEQSQEPFARTIPADYLRTVREWITSQAGHAHITIGTAEGRLVLSSPHTEIRIPVTESLEFPDWRAVLRAVARQPSGEELFPALDTGHLARWSEAGSNVRVRITAEDKPIIVFAEDFIGAQMTARYAGVGPVKDETFGSARSLWKTILADGPAADMATAMPYEEDRPRYEATKDVRETGEALLQQVMHSTADMRGKSASDPDEFMAHVMAGVHAWMAYRYLDALHTADPRLAAEVAADVAEQLDSGELGEFAWDAAKDAGHDPQKWHDDYEAHLKKRSEERRQDEAAQPVTTT